jgi:hypothetical protein
MTVAGTAVARHGRLACTLEDRPDPDTTRLSHYRSSIRKVTAEQSGPLRATIKIEGVYKAENGSRERLPFTVRLYFYAGQTAVRMVRTVVFDGDQEKDFIKALGVTFSVPMREQTHNRYVRFSGEGEGLWSEPLEPLVGARGLAAPGAAPATPGAPPSGELYAAQIAGRRVPNKDHFNSQGQFLLDN